MVYIVISGHSVEAIQTSKSVIGGEKIISSAHLEIPDGLIINGLISDPEKLAGIFKELFTSSYPNPIKEKSVAIAISDQQIFIDRFILPKAKEDLAMSVIEQVKKVLPYEPTELENFYQILDSDNEHQEIFYAAMTKNIILNYHKFIKLLGLDLKFLCTRSLAIFSLIKYLIEKDEKVLYMDVGKSIFKLTLFDQKGILKIFDYKHVNKSFLTECKIAVKSLTDNPKFAPQKIILSGSGSIEINAPEMQNQLGIPVIKMADRLDDLLSQLKISIDTGGFSKLFVINPISLMLFTGSASPANFATDLISIPDTNSANVPSIPVTEEKINPPKTEEKETLLSTPDMKMQADDYGKMVSPVIEEKKGINKMVIMILAVIAGFLAVLGIFFYMSSGKPGINLPFIAGPTLTPTPTLVPTITPTPTIDAKLKRTDLKLAVQNGTSKSGFAKEIATFLETKGYKDINVSNADKDTYESSVIKIKESKKNYQTLLVTDIGEKFVTDQIETLDDENKFDVVIILGQK